MGININLYFAESIIVATAVLHNIVCYFGKQISRVSYLLEHEIDINTFSTRDAVNNPINDGNLKRNNLVRCIESL